MGILDGFKLVLQLLKRLFTDLHRLYEIRRANDTINWKCPPFWRLNEK